MRYAIPLLGDRIAPRCTIADCILLLTVARNKVRSQRVLPVRQHTWDEVIQTLLTAEVDTLVCGGISRAAKETVVASDVKVVENVAGTTSEIVRALRVGNLHDGFGLEVGYVEAEFGRGELVPGLPEPQEAGATDHVDCLSCLDRTCLRGQSCHLAATQASVRTSVGDRGMLESAMDISWEEDRVLCRVSELVYFCLDMKYRRLGLPFCIDLLDSTEILASVLRRHFEVFPVCCKVGGIRVSDPMMSRDTGLGGSEYEHISCNPIGQAGVLDEIGTDLNVAVGLCMGADCMFARASSAPVTTLFVKDRSLANNPIGALYSEYYLREASGSSRGAG
jgi:uncharacterized metal-binding protein/predicted Fe-Mo cluster-binding NifX family protein